MVQHEEGAAQFAAHRFSDRPLAKWLWGKGGFPNNSTVLFPIRNIWELMPTFFNFRFTYGEVLSKRFSLMKLELIFQEIDFGIATVNGKSVLNYTFVLEF